MTKNGLIYPLETRKSQKIFADIRNELQLNTPYNPTALLGQNNQVDYSLPRCLIESVSNGSHRFISEGVLQKTQIQIQPGVVKNAIDDRRTFEGWRYHGPQQ